MCDSCEKTEFGCCQDLENAALGPDFQGCPDGEPKFIDCTTTVTFILFSILTQMFLSFPKYVIVGCAKALERSVLNSIFFYFNCDQWSIEPGKYRTYRTRPHSI